VRCGICDTPGLRRGAAGLSARVGACAGAAEYVHNVFVGSVRLGVWGVALVVCVYVSVSGVLFSVGVCV